MVAWDKVNIALKFNNVVSVNAGRSMPTDVIYGTEYHTHAHAHLDKDTIKLEGFTNFN